MRSRVREAGAVSVTLGALLLSLPAHGQAVLKVVTLDVIERGVPPALAQRATLLLRAQAARTPGYQGAPAPALRLRPMMLALGCPRLEAACLGRIARQLEVQQVLYGEIGRTANGHLLRVQLFDAPTSLVVRTVEREIADSETPASFEAAVQDTAALALGAKLQLTVESSVEGAFVLVNGQPVGTTPLTTRDGLRGGTNEVLVRLSGYKDSITKVFLRPGKPIRVRAVLEPLAKPPAIVKRPEPDKGPAVVAATPFYKKWWFWTIVGAAVAGGTTAAVVMSSSGASPSRVGVEF